MDLLLHICCAPCSVACVKTLREEGTEPVEIGRASCRERV